jgi:hypothetical protein
MFGDRLNDLWHFNGNATDPLWTPYLSPFEGILWPPAWTAPIGWATQSKSTDATASATTADGFDHREDEDEDEGELWLVAGSGNQDEYAYEEWGTMWRFIPASEKWERLQSPTSIKTPWPTRRTQAAAVPTHTGAFVFGGVFGTGGSECGQDREKAPCDSREDQCSDVVSTLWNWQT